MPRGQIMKALPARLTKPLEGEDADDFVYWHPMERCNACLVGLAILNSTSGATSHHRRHRMPSLTLLYLTTHEVTHGGPPPLT